MGIGSEVDAGQPSIRWVGGTLHWHLDWGWRANILPGADQWHSATDDSTHITHAEKGDLVVAANDANDPEGEVNDVLSNSRAATPWATAKSEAASRGQSAALLAKCVSVYSS